MKRQEIKAYRPTVASLHKRHRRVLPPHCHGFPRPPGWRRGWRFVGSIRPLPLPDERISAFTRMAALLEI